MGFATLPDMAGPTLRDRLRRRGRLLRLRGDAVECPCCGGRFVRFLPDPRRGTLECPRCGAHDRHRAVWLWLGERTDLLSGNPMRVLHWAPERAIEARLRARPELDYTSADLRPGAAMATMDITAIPAPDGAYDAILCVHVLEHVPDDRTALRELHRVLAPGGWALVLSPIDVERARTYEDPAVVTPAERQRAYWEHDHVRLYGRDFQERLEEAGFRVEVDDWVRHLDEATIARHGLFRSEDMYVCRKVAGD